MAEVGAETDIAAPYRIMTQNPTQNMLTQNPIETVTGLQNIDLQKQRMQLNQGEMVRQQLGISSDKIDLHKKQIDYAYSQLAGKINDPDLKWADVVNGVNDMATDRPDLLSRSQAAQILAHGPKFAPKTGDPIQDREAERAAVANWVQQHAATLEHSRLVLDFMQGGSHEFKDANGVVHYQNDQQFRANQAGGASPGQVVGAGGAGGPAAPGGAPGTPAAKDPGKTVEPGPDNHFAPSGTSLGAAGQAPQAIGGGFAPGENVAGQQVQLDAAKQFQNAQHNAASFTQRMQPLQIMHEMLGLVGPSATGPEKVQETLAKANRLAAMMGLGEITNIKDVDLLYKSMAQNALQQAAASGDTDAHQALTSMANPNKELSLEANKEILKNLVAMERMKQVGYQEFVKTKLPPAAFPEWFATKYQPNVDVNGFRHDLDNEWVNGKNAAQAKLAELAKPENAEQRKHYDNATHAMHQNGLHWGPMAIKDEE